MCDSFKCYSLNVVHTCSIVVHKWVWMLGYISPLFLCFLQQSLFLFLNIILHFYYELLLGSRHIVEQKLMQVVGDY